MGRRRRKQPEKDKFGDKDQVTDRLPNSKQDAERAGDDEPTLGELIEQKATSLHSEFNMPSTSDSDRIHDIQSNMLKKSGGEENKSSTRRDAPREISSRRPVPAGRNAWHNTGLTSAPKHSLRRFDPRFEDHCGDLRHLHIERNYKFLGEARERRRAELETLISNGGAPPGMEGKCTRKSKRVAANPRIVENATKELEKMEQADLRRKAILTRREVEKEFKEREKELVRKGKKPYFLKERDLRRLELRKKFQDLKKEGGVQKFIDKKRRRIVGKQKKLLSQPSSRDTNT